MILKSSYKTIFKNISFRVSGNLFSKLLGLITLPLISRAFGPEIYGQWSLILVILKYVAFIVTFGFVQFGIREIAQNELYKTTVNNLLSTRLVISLFSLAIAALVLLVVYSNNLRFVFTVLIGYLVVLAQAINLDFYFYAKKNVLIPTLSQIVGQLVFVLGVYFFIKGPKDLSLLVFIYGIYNIVAAGIGVFFYIEKSEFPKIKFSVISAYKQFKQTFRIGLASKIEFIQTTFPILIISYLLTDYQLGLYAAAYKFFSIVLLAYQAIILSLSPYLVRLKEFPALKSRKLILMMASGMLVIGLIFSFLLFISGHLFIDLIFGQLFKDAFPVFSLINFFMIPFWPLYMVLASVILYTGNDSFYLRLTIIMGLLIVFLTPVLTKFYALSGAVYAISFSNIIAIVIALNYLNRLFPKEYSNDYSV